VWLGEVARSAVSGNLWHGQISIDCAGQAAA
jgi:hypothetical protein